MKPQAYLIFHLNLAFSSIDRSSWSEIIERCYWPLLDIISDQDIPLGIEVTGWTLNNIQEKCPEWTLEFKKLLEKGKCELIGSGYCQIISPLVPYEVNLENQKIGLGVYERILGIRPSIALVNEMAFSESAVDLYSEVGYSGFIMDRDNVRLALDCEHELIQDMPGSAKGNSKVDLPVLWGDSILFQKLQHVAHGDISMDDYVSFVEKRISSDKTAIPLYCNDAETFDFRPGRFKEERSANLSGEWETIRLALSRIKDDLNVVIISPSEALEIQKSHNIKSKRFSTAGYPIPVKKQAKYNIARWAVTGRDDTWLNTMCYRIFLKLKGSDNVDSKDWANLCELWASDLRTHITENRWVDAKHRINSTLTTLGVNNHYGFTKSSTSNFDVVSYQDHLGDFKCNIFGDGIYLLIENRNIKIIFNLRRGLAIDSLAFSSHGKEPSLVTLKHGTSESILQGSDFYSGGVVIEAPESRIKITDLHPVVPLYSIDEEGNLILRVSIDTQLGTIVKQITIKKNEEALVFSYKMGDLKYLVSSARLGNLTLSPEFSDCFSSYSCSTGGSEESIFHIEGDFEQSKAASSFVSSSRGFSATTGELSLNCKKNKLYIAWDPSECFPLTFIDHKDGYSRVSFSVSEVDDTSRESGSYGDFQFNLSTSRY
jgi:hypothetical protein